jgi:hypothetical protein
VRTFDVIRACRRLAAPILFASLGLSAAAQTPASQGGTERPVVVPSEQPAPALIARPSEMDCSGFIEHNPPSDRLEIVGGEEEQEQRAFGQGDYVYINGGAQQSVKVGDEFSVVRPRGRFKSSFSGKSGSLGMYTQELGRLRVVSVKQNVSVALVTKSCDNLLLGDLLRVTPQKVVAVARAEEPLDRFAEPTGKQRGRIVLARDGREMVSRDQVVFIDLGTEDNVKPGDYLTVYRPVGTGNISRYKDKEVTPGGSGGFESDIFRGGKHSTKAQRVKDPVDGGYKSTITTPEIQSRRPSLPRKVVGEIVIISVEARTAAAVITRTAQEIHTGDFVEAQ